MGGSALAHTWAGLFTGLTQKMDMRAKTVILHPHVTCYPILRNVWLVPISYQAAHLRGRANPSGERKGMTKSSLKARHTTQVSLPRSQQGEINCVIKPIPNARQSAKKMESPILKKELFYNDPTKVIPLQSFQSREHTRFLSNTHTLRIRFKQSLNKRNPFSSQPPDWLVSKKMRKPGVPMTPPPPPIELVPPPAELWDLSIRRFHNGHAYTPSTDVSCLLIRCLHVFSRRDEIHSIFGEYIDS